VERTRALHAADATTLVDIAGLGPH
jgi:hypothetical protein